MRLLGEIDARRPRPVALAVLIALLVAVGVPTLATSARAATVQAVYPLPPGPSTTVPIPSRIDPFPRYVPQTTCDPTAKPGPGALLKLAMDHYKAGRNTGISRGCTVGGTSEHKEGRAFDWGLRVDRPAEKAAGDAFSTWLTATGPDGKAGYNARRLGVMYVIWNKRIWTAYSATPGWRAYYGASPHTDHVHVSMSWNGAYKRTSWWTGSLVAQAPIGKLESVTATSTDITVKGWAMDPDTSDSTDVHVYVNGRGTAVPADLPRHDIGTKYGRGDDHGFAVTLPQEEGRYSVCAYAIDSDPSGNTSLGCRTVEVKDHEPIGAVDRVTTTSTSISLSGWALDPDSSDPTAVHVFVDGGRAELVADLPRPDIERAFGRGDRHGFVHTVQVTPGPHDVCVRAQSSVPGPETTLLCRSVTAMTPPTATPLGRLDSVVPSPTGVTVSGWALDPDTAGPSTVKLRIDGVRTVVHADQRRPDVAAALGKGDRRGFAATLPLKEGSHELCVWAENTGAGADKKLGCRTFEVRNHAPIGVLEAVVPAKGQVTVSGWALDPDTTAPNAAHVYIDGIGVAVRADRSRPDVGRVHRKGDKHGFVQTAYLKAGRHEVCVYSIDTTGPGHTLLGCRPFVVPA